MKKILLLVVGLSLIIAPVYGSETHKPQVESEIERAKPTPTVTIFTPSPVVTIRIPVVAPTVYLPVPAPTVTVTQAFPTVTVTQSVPEPAVTITQSVPQPAVTITHSVVAPTVFITKSVPPLAITRYLAGKKEYITLAPKVVTIQKVITRGGSDRELDFYLGLLLILCIVLLIIRKPIARGKK